ncbi:hypothetical protein Plav_0060 [Parvibaculum lavamentivorans DS-1]|uniref:DUF3309 domain-containing protein n=2 Tax=Parvibaculaceae TaxID=2813035 RepID=A7HP50_PARL1|nr:hypothetical protein Plav_0060 [Parvibaculum lavamentivorans DS-1]
MCKRMMEPEAPAGVSILSQTGSGSLSMSTILLVILILLIIGAVPSWPYSRGWGYGPSGLLGVLLIVLIVLLLTGRV